MTRPRLGVRSRLLLVVVGAVALALMIAVVVFNLLLEQRLSANATSLAKARAEAETSALEVRDGKLVPPEGPDEGTLGSQAWAFSGLRALEAPTAPMEVDRAARSLASGPERSVDVGEATRLYAIPVVQDGTRYGTVVSAVSLDPYEETERTALIGSLVLAALLLAAITALSRWMLGRALLPVSQMTEDAAAWSEHALDRRFGLGEPHDELTQLAATLDQLLDQAAASLRREQRFAAELSHELRTPLARISGEAELMLNRERTPESYREALETIHRSAAQMTRTVDALVAAARQEAGQTRATSDVRDAIRAAVNDVPSRAGVDVRVSLPPEAVRVGVEGELVERMVQPLLENAVRYGRSSVEVSLVRNGHAVKVLVVDDGPGVGESERIRIFEPGARGSAAAGRDDGAGLGLALAQRLAQSAGGEITVAPDRVSGRFSLRLPLAG